MNGESILDFKQKALPVSINKTGWTLFLLGLLLSVIAFIFDPQRGAFNLLIIFMFIMSVGVGSLFLVALEYVAGAVWSTPYRRVSEFLSVIIYILPVMAIILLFNMHNLFEWMDPSIVSTDKVLQSKSSYLNLNFFIIRTAVIILIWLLFYWLIIRNSRIQDITKDQNLTKRNIRISAVFMPVFALTLTVASIDWMMSLEPHWYSTIFGVYYFAGTILAALAAVTIIVVLLRENGFMNNLGLTKDHYYSLGALLFAFTNFWAYIAFSQYMLIWYANLPEETAWFITRWEGSWKFISIGLILFQFVIPYIGLLSQPSKMDPKRLLRMASIILFAHFYDLYWMVMPEFNKGGILFGWIEIGFTLLAAGIIILVFVSKVRKNNLIPVGDPKLQRGLEFKL